MSTDVCPYASLHERSQMTLHTWACACMGLHVGAFFTLALPLCVSNCSPAFLLASSLPATVITRYAIKKIARAQPSAAFSFPTAVFFGAQPVACVLKMGDTGHPPYPATWLKTGTVVRPTKLHTSARRWLSCVSRLVLLNTAATAAVAASAAPAAVACSIGEWWMCVFVVGVCPSIISPDPTSRNPFHRNLLHRNAASHSIQRAIKRKRVAAV